MLADRIAQQKAQEERAVGGASGIAVWEQRQADWGGRDRNVAGGGWLRSREGPWHPDSHDDPGTQGLTRSGKSIWLMVSQDAGPGWQSRATLSMGRGRYHLWPVKLPRRLGTNCAQEW